MFTFCATLRTQGGEWDARKKAFVFQRYCHVYKSGELEQLCWPLVEAGWVEVEDVYYDTGNWCVVARKTAPAPTVSFSLDLPEGDADGAAATTSESPEAAEEFS